MGAANAISGNGGAGIAIYNASTGNRISGNSITGNNGLGIDLWNDGVTANDPNDADPGPNNLQNFPVLTDPATLGLGTTINGTLNSTANTAFRIEFFASPAGDPTGYGEGQNFIGAISVTTNAGGSATIAATLPAIVPLNQKISATATDPAGNTSEFSQNITVSPTPATPDSDSDGIPDAWMLAKFGHATGQAADKSRPGDDADGDGMTNAQEFRAGTNPKSAASVLRLAAPVISGSDTLLTLPTVAGHFYRIDFADALSSPTAWRILADQIPGTGAAITLTDPGAAPLPQRFYRAVVEP